MSLFRLSEDGLAQMSHFLAGALLTSAAGMFHYWWIGASAAGAWSLFKEIYWDPFVLKDDWADNLKDLLFWGLGILSGMVLVKLAHL